ncbi:hypothetical protein D3C80_1797060 [compost metagenome]
MAWIIVRAGIGLQVHDNPVDTDLETVTFVQTHRGAASQGQVMAVDVSAVAQVGHTETAFMPVDPAMLRAHAA